MFQENCGSHRDEHHSFSVLVVYDEHLSWKIDISTPWNRVFLDKLAFP